MNTSSWNIVKFKMILLNAICLFLLLLFSVLFARQLFVSETNLHVDYSVIYHSLQKQNSAYHIYFFQKIKSIEFQNNIQKIIFFPGQMDVVNLNTPTFNIFLKLLVSLSVYGWIFISLLGAAISLFVLMRWILTSNTLKYFFIPLLLILWISWPNSYNLTQGQVTLFLLPLLSIGFVLLSKKKYLWASVLLGFLSSLKLFFLIFLLFFGVRAQWRLFLIFCIVFLASFFLPLFYFNWHDYHLFFQLLSNDELILKRTVAQMNGSLLGVISNAFRLSNISFSVIKIKIIFEVIFAFVIFCWIFYDYFYIKRLTEFGDEISFSFLITLALLLSPLAWLYYFLFLLIPLVVMIKVSEKYKLPRFFFYFFILALVFPLFCFVLLSHKEIGWQIIRALVLFLSLLCWLKCLRDIAAAVYYQNKIQNSINMKWPVLIIFYGIVSLIGLSLDPRMNFVLQWNKENYLKTIPPSVWVRDKN